jgi:hypothetical protein
MKRGFLLTPKQEVKQEEELPEIPSNSQCQDSAIQAKDPTVIFNYLKQEEELPEIPSSSQYQDSAIQAKDPIVIFNYLKQWADKGIVNASLIYHLYSEALKRAAIVEKNATVAEAFNVSAQAFHEAAIKDYNLTQYILLMSLSSVDLVPCQLALKEFQQAATVSSTVENLEVEVAADKYATLIEGLWARFKDLSVKDNSKFKKNDFTSKIVLASEIASQKREALLALDQALVKTAKAFKLAASVASNIKVKEYFQEAAAASSVANSKFCEAHAVYLKENSKEVNLTLFFSSLAEVAIAATKAYNTDLDTISSELPNMVIQ